MQVLNKHAKDGCNKTKVILPNPFLDTLGGALGIL